MIKGYVLLLSVADGPEMPSLRGARGRLPFRRLHLRGLQGEIDFFCPILHDLNGFPLNARIQVNDGNYAGIE